MLKKLTLLRDRVEDWTAYPFTVPVIRSLDELTFTSRVCCFTGENGSGKSTLLEAIAAHYGFGREGGTRNFQNSSTPSNFSIDPLVRALRLAFDIRTGQGYYLRAESLFNVATHIDDLGVEGSYGDRSLHTRSHGETFLTLLDLKFRRNGLFLLDEPEAALSPQRQLAFLALIHSTLKYHRDAQFILATHSPLLLGFPKAQIISFDGERLREIPYEKTSPALIVGDFVRRRASILAELFRDEDDDTTNKSQPTLFT